MVVNEAEVERERPRDTERHRDRQRETETVTDKFTAKERLNRLLFSGSNLSSMS